MKAKKIATAPPVETPPPSGPAPSATGKPTPPSKADEYLAKKDRRRETNLAADGKGATV